MASSTEAASSTDAVAASAAGPTFCRGQVAHNLWDTWASWGMCQGQGEKQPTGARGIFDYGQADWKLGSWIRNGWVCGHGHNGVNGWKWWKRRCSTWGTAEMAKMVKMVGKGIKMVKIIKNG